MENMEDKSLRTWQLAVVAAIDLHDDFIGSEDNQSLSDYEINRLSSISVKFPKGSGNTWLTAYIAKNYDSSIVYIDHDHWKEIEVKVVEMSSEKDRQAYFPFMYKEGEQERDFPYSFNAISMYEIFYGTTQGAINEYDLESLKRKLGSSKVVVVDRASELSGPVVDFLFAVSKGIVVLLG